MARETGVEASTERFWDQIDHPSHPPTIRTATPTTMIATSSGRSDLRLRTPPTPSFERTSAVACRGESGRSGAFQEQAPQR